MTGSADRSTGPAAYRGGSGTPLVCLHGFTATWWTWKPILPQLTEHHRVFAPTLPGHYGGPPLPRDRELDVESLVDLAAELLDAEGIETAHLVGNSGGGWLALALAERGRARSVVALSPGGGWDPGSKIDRRVRRFFVRGQRMAPRAAPFARAIAARPGLRRLAFRDVVAHPERIAPDMALQMMRAVANCEIAAPFLELWGTGEFPPRVGEIDCPVRIAWGTHDRLLPAARCAAGFTALEDAEWVMLPGAGHVPTHDDPPRVARTILDVTTRVDASEREAERAAAVTG